MGIFSSFFGGGGSGRSSSKRNWSPRSNGGPLVRSGPTFGKVRSRNLNGQWRKKRS